MSNYCCNVNEDDYRQAISALIEYERILIEIGDVIIVASKEAEKNLSGNDNIKNINANLNKRVVEIHDVCLHVRNLAKQLSNELRDIINTNKSLD